jgi:hypothetical protein
VVVPAAIVVAVGAALVHGFVDSGSNSVNALSPAVRANPRLNDAMSKVVHGSGALKGTSQQEAANNGGTPISKTAGTADSAVAAQALKANTAFGPVRRSVTIPQNRLVHAVASLQVGVKSKDLSAKTNEASQIAASYGGYAQSIHYQASKQGEGEAVVELRVPVQNAEKAIGKLTGLGTVLSQQVSTQDLQAKLTHQTSGIGALRRAIAVYEHALESTTLPASQRVDIQIKLNNARRALARLRHARAGTLAAGATASISLVLTTRNHAIVAHNKSGSTRIGRLLGSAAHFLALEGIIVLYALIVLAPFLLLGALAWWIVHERRRREERLLASA